MHPVSNFKNSKMAAQSGTFSFEKLMLNWVRIIRMKEIYLFIYITKNSSDFVIIVYKKNALSIYEKSLTVFVY